MPTFNDQRASAIRRSQRRSQAILARRLAELERELLQLYRAAAETLGQVIENSADVDGVIPPQALPSVRATALGVIDRLVANRQPLIDQALAEFVDLGLSPFATESDVIDLGDVRRNTIRQIRAFAAEDGLRLADRVGRIDTAFRNRLIEVLEQRVATGLAFSQSVEQFIGTDLDLPQDILALRGMAAARAAAQEIRIEVDGGKQYRAALQIIRTESIRAKGLAHRNAAEAHPDVVGVQYNLSPRHPRPDICDLHAGVNRYGLGPGVYPPERSPWPAHPNTLSFEQVVFRDEITEDDRETTMTRIEFLKTLPDETVKEALGGSPEKFMAFQRGLVNERSITTPWRVLRQRLERQGVNIESIEAAAKQ